MQKTFLSLLNHLLQLLSRYRWRLFWGIYGFGFAVYFLGCGRGLLASLYQSFALFTLNINPAEDAACNTWLYVAGLLAALYTTTSVIQLIARRFIQRQQVAAASRQPYILVCGLGEHSAAYIDSERAVNPAIEIIVIEQQPDNPRIARCREQGVAVRVGDARDVHLLETLSLHNARHIVVMAGRDSDNLEIALALRDVFTRKKLPPKKLFLHIEDRGLHKFYKGGGLLDDQARLEVKLFSIVSNSARTLFLEHSVDGADRSVIDSNQPFALAVVGDTALALAVIGQIGELAHLPNENPLTLYCIAPNAATLRQRILQHYPGIGEIPGLNLACIALDHRHRDFYTHELWRDNLRRIMLCHDDAQANLDIAAELADSVYLKAIVDKTLQTHIHIAIHDYRLLARHIEHNTDHFRNFHVFAQTRRMASRDCIVDERFEAIARCIHAGYEMAYNPDASYQDEAAIETAWKNASLTDRESNRAQAAHIPLKLKAMGLRLTPSDQPPQQLLAHNRAAFRQTALYGELAQLGLAEADLIQRTAHLKGEQQWATESFDWFPETYQTLMEKLLRAEHNRWNANHWLRGWQRGEPKDKSAKRHPCLVPLDKLPADQRHTVLYDIYSVLYIPNLLARAGYRMEKESAPEGNAIKLSAKSLIYIARL